MKPLDNHFRRIRRCRAFFASSLKCNIDFEQPESMATLQYLRALNMDEIKLLMKRIYSFCRYLTFHGMALYTRRVLSASTAHEIYVQAKVGFL